MLSSPSQLLVYADDVNTLCGSIHTIRKNTEILLIASKEIGLEVNAEKTKYMVMSRDQNAGQNGCIQIQIQGAFALYSSPNIKRMIKSRTLGWAGQVACMEEGRGAYRVLVSKPERRRPLVRPRHRWYDNIKMHFRQME
jgi:hypothetical protein